MTQTRRELEFEMCNQRLTIQKAEQKADDAGYALELLLNNGFNPFYSSTTSDGERHEFLIGVVRNIPIDDISRLKWKGPQTEDRRIILWKTTFESDPIVGSAYHDEEFKSLPGKLEGQSPKLQKLLLEAIQHLP